MHPTFVEEYIDVRRKFNIFWDSTVVVLLSWFFVIILNVETGYIGCHGYSEPPLKRTPSKKNTIGTSLKPRTHDQVVPWRDLIARVYSWFLFWVSCRVLVHILLLVLYTFCCRNKLTCIKLTSFSLTRSLAFQKLVMPAFGQRKLFVCTHVTARKTCPAFVKENLFVVHTSK